MLLARLLNTCHHFPGFVYGDVRLVDATSTIEVEVRPRRGSEAHCSCCGKAAPGYDLLPTRRFEFIPIRGYAVMRVCSCACSSSSLGAPASTKLDTPSPPHRYTPSSTRQ